MQEQGKTMRQSSVAFLLAALVSSAACAQVNAGAQKSDPGVPFNMTQWRP